MTNLKTIIAKARDDLVADVAAFQERTGMRDSTFGRKALGDPTFMYWLRRGRVPSPDRMEVVYTFMKTYKAPKRSAAGKEAAAAA
jgi:hypothetical protein